MKPTPASADQSCRRARPGNKWNNSTWCSPRTRRVGGSRRAPAHWSGRANIRVLWSRQNRQTPLQPPSQIRERKNEEAERARSLRPALLLRKNRSRMDPPWGFGRVLETEGQPRRAQPPPKPMRAHEEGESRKESRNPCSPTHAP